MLAFVCGTKGYPLRIVSSDALAAEKARHAARHLGVFSGRRPAPTWSPRSRWPATSARGGRWSPCRVDSGLKYLSGALYA
jgi:hypothetical protein